MPRAKSFSFPFGLLCILLLAACAPNADYLPLQTGHWWYYQADALIRGEPRTERLLIANIGSHDATTVQQIGDNRRTLTRVDAGILAHSDSTSPPSLLLPMI